MAITSYDELQAAILGRLKRTSSDVDAEEFISLAEGDFNDTVRSDDMVATATLTLTAGTSTVALPTSPRYLATLAAVLLTNPRAPLDFVAADQLDSLYSDTAGGRPRVYSIVAGNLDLRPIPDDAYDIRLTFYGAITPLSDGAPSNWLLATRPNLYLYRSVEHGLIHIGDEERAATFAALADQATGRLNRAANRGRQGGVLRRRPQVAPP